MKDQVRTPLRTVLRNFLNHIEKLESSTCPEKSYDVEFQDLKLFSESVKSLKEYACTEGEKETNKKKNRYKDILPFDVSRVILNEYAGIPGSDYINANYIKGASGSPAYIASQGPLPCTVNDFWRMVVQCEVQVIVMACNEEEAGKTKCEKYWVDDGEEKQFGMICVKLLKASTVCPDFSVRTMRLKYTNTQNVIEERTVCQLHYVAWPDHGVPTVVQPLLEMVRLVRDTQASETLPVLVHCSAGCGRTGTICAIDYVWGLLRTGKLTNDFSLLSLIRDMRKQRIAMVQTKEQYVLVHQAVRELFKEQLLMIDSHPYENVDPDGLLIMKEEENHYDVVENLSNIILEEKKDNTMEKDAAPPLPHKKHTLYPSKREKDVENLSAQQRSIMRSSKGKQPIGNLARQSLNVAAPREVQDPPAVKKNISNPIPSKGILRVPHLRSISSAPVKRSKSLKLTDSSVRQKMVAGAEIPMEPRRRGSLESNIDEVGSVVGDSVHNEMPFEDFSPAKETENTLPVYDTPRSVQKYDMLKYLEEKRMLVRSLTTYDMRQKMVAQHSPLEALSAGNTPIKCKLSRSNTQIDFSRLLRSRAEERNQNVNSGLKARNIPRKFNQPDSHGSLSIFMSMGDGKASHGQGNKNMPANKKVSETVDLSENSPLLGQMEKAHPLAGRTKTLDDFHCHRVSQRSMVNLQGAFKNSGGDPTANPKWDVSRQFHENVYTSSESSSRITDVKRQTPKAFNKLPVYDNPYRNCHKVNDAPYLRLSVNGAPPVEPSSYDPRKRSTGGEKHNGLAYLEHHSQHQPKKLAPHTQLDAASAPSHADYQVTSNGPRSLAENPPVVAKPFEQGNSRMRNKRGTYSPRENEQRYGVRCAPPQPSTSLDMGLARLPNGAAGNVWPPPYRLSRQHVGNVKDDHRAPCDGPVQKNIWQQIPTLDSTNMQDTDQSNEDYFSNAPGVDLDQVAASIPQKDISKTNLMKVALEAFNIKRSRQQARLPDSSPSASSSSKGSSPSSTMVNTKKKQQQYL